MGERLNNVRFKPLEFEGIRNMDGLNSFVLTTRVWIDSIHASGLVSKSGRYGGTCAIQAHLVPSAVTQAQAAITYAGAADLLNVALFGKTAKQ